MNKTELLQKRAGLVAEARKVLDKADAEKRSLSAEEKQSYDAHMKDVDGIAGRIKEFDEAEQRRSLLEKHERELTASAGRKTGPDAPGAAEEKRADPLKVELRSRPGSGRMYEEVELRSEGAVSSESKAWTEKAIRLSLPERRANYARWLAGGDVALTRDEYRDIQADSDVSGGYLNAPMQMLAQLLKFVDNAVVIRQKATVYQVPNAESLGVPTLEADLNDADWTAELATGAGDTGMQFGRRSLQPHPLAKRIKISNKLLRTAVIGPESIVRDRLGYKFGIAQEKAYMTGSGAQQPLGLFTASALGISTGRDFSTGNTTTAMSFDGLITAKYALKPQYQMTAEWLFHRDAIAQIRKLKDGNGRYLWQPAVSAGQPDTILERPVNQSEYAPNTFTTGLYTGLIGDFRFYWIADALQLQVQRLVELYAETNQVGFIGRLESDGMPVLEEAFARVKLA